MSYRFENDVTLLNTSVRCVLFQTNGLWRRKSCLPKRIDSVARKAASITETRELGTEPESCRVLEYYGPRNSRISTTSILIRNLFLLGQYDDEIHSTAPCEIDSSTLCSTLVMPICAENAVTYSNAFYAWCSRYVYRLGGSFLHYWATSQRLGIYQIVLGLKFNKCNGVRNRVCRRVHAPGFRQR